MNKYISTFEIGESEYKLKDSEARTEISGKSSLLRVNIILPENGVYAIYSDGSLKTAAEADTDALGVAIIADECCFIIDKTNKTTSPWDSLFYKNGDIVGCVSTNSTSSYNTEARTDFAGVSNTDAIIRVETGGEAAKYCRQLSITINGITKQGYLAGFGEMGIAFDKINAVNSVMTAIGGTKLDYAMYWSSTQYKNVSGQSIAMRLGFTDVATEKEEPSLFVIPFYAITKEELGEKIITPTQTVNIEQITGTSTTNIMSQNAVSNHILDKNVHVTAAEKEYWNSKINPPYYSAPTAKRLTYTGSAQDLLNAGSSTSGNIQYSTDKTNWSTTVPLGTNAGTYTVYWRFINSDMVYVDSTAITVIIAKANPTYTAPTGKSNLIYDGTELALINAGSSSDGVFKYSLDGINWQPIADFNNHDYIDLGLPSGTKWAIMNIGAESETLNGNFYMYGKGTTTYNSSDSAYTGTESPLDSSVDTARLVMGGTWHMPTYDLAKELLDNTTWTWYSSGNKGLQLTGNNGNQIFLPACGVYRNGSNNDRGYMSAFWTSTPRINEESFYMMSVRGLPSSTLIYIGLKTYGIPVRGVIEGGSIPSQTNAGTYTVYWKFEGDENHNDVTGTVEVTIGKANRTVSFLGDNGYEYVDLGTSDGTLWATMNVGANSITDYGNYYMYGKGATTYNRSDSMYTGMEDPLDLSLDTARLVMGGGWHTPTFLQLTRMKNATTFEWTTIDGVAGGKYTAKNGSGNYIFIPASGRFEERGSTVLRLGSSGYIWSSTPYNNNYAYYLDLYDSSTWTNNVQRWYGMPIRGVLEPSLKTELLVGSTNTIEVFTEGSPTITLSSSDINVATVSGMTVTAVGSGTTTITATVAGDSNYNSTDISYTLKVPYPNGIYAAYADGSMRTAENADTNAIGVAVITDNCKFIIDKTNNTNAAWDSQYSTNGVIAGCFATDNINTAKTNYTGVSNTNAIAAVASGGEAAKYCRSCSKTVAGKTVYGYLGACGEWQTAYDNKATVNSIMSTIGGTAISDYYYWTSTLSLRYSTNAWDLYWGNGGVYPDTKNRDSRLVRPLYEIS